MKDECKQAVVMAYKRIPDYMRDAAINCLCTRYGTEFVAQCIVELGLDMEDIYDMAL